MKKSEQEKLVLEKLYLKRRLELNEVMELLNVSESTVRRIFNVLESTGKAIRTHGGISIINDTVSDYSFDLLVKAHPDIKIAIAELASAEIHDGDIIYLDCGTTILSLCLKIAQLLRDGNYKSTQFFTNSLANLEILSPLTQVNLIGGKYRPNRKDFAGYMSELVLKELHFTKSFLGADGIGIPASFKAMDFDTARLDQLVINRSDKVYVLADSSKFGKSSLVSYAGASDVDVVITDSLIDGKTAETLESEGIRVMKA